MEVLISWLSRYTKNDVQVRETYFYTSGSWMWVLNVIAADHAQTSYIPY